MCVHNPRAQSQPVTQHSYRKSDQFTTLEDFQTEIDICVYEGERASTDGNNLLGKFVISGIERAKAGVPKIVVTFDLDANGSLKVGLCEFTDALAYIYIYIYIYI
jgi:molecular chaperone DnaK (HSP70)